MRLPLIAVLLLATASCAWQPPPPPGTPVVAASASAPVELLSPSPQVAAPASPAPPPNMLLAAYAPPPPFAAYGPVYLPNPSLILAPLFSPVMAGPASGRLTLSNFSFDRARVEALVTPYPDCAIRPGMVPADFMLRLNSTWAIPTPPGSDVCWRRAVPATPGSAAQGNAPAAVPGWTDWNRAFTGPGRLIDAEL